MCFAVMFGYLTRISHQRLGMPWGPLRPFGPLLLIFELISKPGLRL
jgi:hypothetical protein